MLIKYQLNRLFISFEHPPRDAMWSPNVAPVMHGDGPGMVWGLSRGAHGMCSGCSGHFGANIERFWVPRSAESYETTPRSDRIRRETVFGPAPPPHEARRCTCGLE